MEWGKAVEAVAGCQCAGFTVDAQVAVAQHLHHGGTST